MLQQSEKAAAARPKKYHSEYTKCNGDLMVETGQKKEESRDGICSFLGHRKNDIHLLQFNLFRHCHRILLIFLRRFGGLKSQQIEICQRNVCLTFSKIGKLKFRSDFEFQ